MALIRKEDVLDMMKKARSDMIYPSWYQVLTQRVDWLHTYEERKTGKWVKDEYGTDHCSCCDYIPAYDTAIDDIYYSPYCPNCGAKMEVDE